MILSAIFHFFKTVIGYAIKIIAWLLVALSLWVPLVYTLIFIIICGLTETSITAIQSWFWAGLAVSFVGSFMVSTFIYERKITQKKRQRAESAPAGNMEKVKEKQDEPLMTKRNESAEGGTESHGTGSESGYPGFSPVSCGEEGALRQSDNQDGGPSLMDKLKQGAPELRATDTASKHNFISYNSVNGESNPYGGQPYGGGYYSENNGFNNSNNGFNAQNNAFNAQNNGLNSFNSGFGGHSGSGGQGGSLGYPGYSDLNGGRGRNDSLFQGQPYQSGFGGEENFKPEYDTHSRGFNMSEDNSFNMPASGSIGRGEGSFARSVDGISRSDYENHPKIFATRSDPTILIYEYSDRLEYYKRTRGGLLLFKTRQKAAGDE